VSTGVALTETHVTIAYLGTTNPNLRNATFKHVWIDPADNRTVLMHSRPARNHTQVTGEIQAEDLHDLLVATHLTLTNTGRLAAPSYKILHHLRTQLAIYLAPPSFPLCTLRFCPTNVDPALANIRDN
jgi:hypothetical protein